MRGEAEARAWVERAFDVPRETMARLEAFVDLLKTESERQNLVAASTLGQLWQRHVADSAQLLRFAPSGGTWLDLGSGAGFPGLAVAALWPGRVTLIEERRLRVAFLREAADLLKVDVEIFGGKAEAAPSRPYDVISARAFAPLGRLLDLGARFSTRNSVWILPKGRNAQSELEAIRPSWQGAFRLEPSLTEADARIVVATGVKRLKGRGKR